MRKNRRIFAVFLSFMLAIGMFAGIGFETEAIASTGVLPYTLIIPFADGRKYMPMYGGRISVQL